MGRRKRTRKVGQAGQPEGAKSSWRTAIIISAVVLAVLVLMLAFGMTDYMDGGW